MKKIENYLCMLDGIYEEKNEVPKEIKKELRSAVGGGGVCNENENWFLSNTAGETHGKFYRKVAGRIYFDIKNREKIEKIKGKSLQEGIEIIKNNIKNNLEFSFRRITASQEEDGCLFKLILDRKDLTTKKHELENDKLFVDLADYYFEKQKACIEIAYQSDIKEIENLIKLLRKKRKETKNSKSGLTIDEIESILEKTKGRWVTWNYHTKQEWFPGGQKTISY